MRISDWSSDVCSSDLCRGEWHSLSGHRNAAGSCQRRSRAAQIRWRPCNHSARMPQFPCVNRSFLERDLLKRDRPMTHKFDKQKLPSRHVSVGPERAPHRSYYYSMGLTQDDIERPFVGIRSEEHTSELQSLMRISYAV